MSYLEKVLDGRKVEWKTLGEVAKIQRGASPRPIAKFITEDANAVPWIKIGDTSNNSRYVTQTKQRITLEGAKKSRILKKGDFIMSNSMSFGRPFILAIEGAIHDGWASISGFEKELNSNFLYHYLSSENVQYYWESKINNGGAVSNLNADIIKSLPIPIPPLDVQKEIVRILDSFTELKSELKSELKARKKQYEYYREQLLSFDKDEVQWKTLGEVLHIKRGKRVVKKQLIDSDCYAVYQNSLKPLGYYNKSNVSADTTFIICAGAAGEIGYSKDKIWAADDVYYFEPNDCFKQKYIYYFLMTKKHLLQRHVRRASIPRLSKSPIEKLSVPIPPLDVQERIVSILDKFDTLTNSISEGLPKEIELRQKQYEYYRDLLLTFPKEG
jgi:type I restriction enzyme S subunit